jgi:hypothetical protein
MESCQPTKGLKGKGIERHSVFQLKNLIKNEMNSGSISVCLHFMGTDGSSLSSQKSANGPYSEPDEST